MLRLIPTLARFQISAKTNRFHRDQNLNSATDGEPPG